MFMWAVKNDITLNSFHIYDTVFIPTANTSKLFC